MRGEDDRIEFLDRDPRPTFHDRRRIEDQRSFIVTRPATRSRIPSTICETLRQVAVLAAGDIADWCSVHIVESDETISQLAIAHKDPTKVTFARELQERYPPDAAAATGVAAVVRTGEPELVPVITDEMIVGAAVDELHLGLLRELGLTSYMCVPLKGRDAVLGAITLVASESGRCFGADDLILAQELARRAANRDRERSPLPARPRLAHRRHACSRRSATASFLVDLSGRVQFWNNAAQWITGLREEDVLGKLALNAIPGWAEMQPRRHDREHRRGFARREHPAAS